MNILIFVAILSLTLNFASACSPSETTASGTSAPRSFCSGDLIFEENFNTLDQSKWQHEITMAGGGNYEFQWYVNDRFNSYTAGGNLHLKPSFTSDIFGEDFLFNGRVVIPPNECTVAWNWGCDRTGSVDHPINPIRSARIDTEKSFSYKYGTLEIRAKMPAGDWIWPALWMMPKDSVYGQWPRSGEIDVMEMRGNRNLFAGGNANVGVEHAESTIHFGPSAEVKNQWPLHHFSRNQRPGWNAGFNIFRFIWTPTSLQFLMNGNIVGTVNAGSGFWNAGNFGTSGLPNPWAQGTTLAPFDQEFFIIINNAVGGTNYFNDEFDNRNGGKPWLNTSPRAAADFWLGRSQWESSWNRAHSDDSHLQIDYVRVWAM